MVRLASSEFNQSPQVPRRSVKVVIVMLLAALSGCANPNVSPVRVSRQTQLAARLTTVSVDSDRAGLNLAAQRVASVGAITLSSLAAASIPPRTVQLAGSHPNDPAWLTGEIEFDQKRKAGRPMSLDLDAPRSGAMLSSFKVSSFTSDPDAFDSAAWLTDSQPPIMEPSIFIRIGSDYHRFYSPNSLAGLAYGLAGGALMANTNFDQTVQAHFQASIRNASSDEWFHTLEAQKKLGNGYYTIPVFAVAWATGSMLEGDPIADEIGEWGERSFRSILVGAPPMLATQYIIGGSRPDESSSGSDWKLFHDNNGVSGHSFMGAVPFLTAAQMAEEPWLKFVLYAGSTLVPLSRINDDDHYTSQAFLGWWFAFLATRAIDSTQSNESDWTFTPWLEPQYYPQVGS